MKLNNIFLLMLFCPLLSSASDINCEGTVTNVMDYPAKCNGNTAFKTTGSNGKWICPPSDKGNAIVLTSFATGKEVGVYIYDQEGTISCENLPHYIPARYVLINQ